MKRMIGILLVLAFLAGCTSNFYQVTTVDYQARVKRIGILPILVDENSTILYPQPEAVVGLLRKSAIGRETRLLDQLVANGGYEQIKVLAVEPQGLVSRLFASNAQQTHKGASYRRYQPNAAVVAELAQSAGVDALLVVVLNGVDAKEKRWDRTHLHFLETNYNTIQASAMVISPSGDVLWERPGYIASPFLDLQYAAFDEAYHNRTDQVRVQFITVEGLERALLATDKSLFGKTGFPTLYRQLFDAITDSLRIGRSWQLRPAVAPQPQGAKP